MLHSKEGSAKKKKGFTLAELLIVIGIIAVLLALATGFVVSIQRSIRQRKLDDCARQIYLSAQQELAYLKYSGRMQEVEDAALSAGGEAGELNYTPSDASDEVIAQINPASGTPRIDLHFFTSECSSLKSLVLPADGIAPELRDAYYVVEYDSINGNVYAVYYADKEAFEESSIPDGGSPVNGSLSGVSYEELRDNKDGSTKAKERQKRTHATIGYYGGSAIWEEIPTEGMDVHLTIQNREQLKLFVSYHEPQEVGSAVTDSVEKMELTVYELDDTGKPDETKKWTLTTAVDLAGAAADKRQISIVGNSNSTGKPVKFEDAEKNLGTGRWMTELVLDSMLVDKGFHDISGLNTGANIRICAKLTTVKGVIADAFIDTNSGFATKETPRDPTNGAKIGADVVKLAYGRHLQNLQNYVATEDFEVEQVRDIHFEDIRPKPYPDPDDPDTDEPDAECWYALYYDSVDESGNDNHIMYRPVTNSRINRFSGRQKFEDGTYMDHMIKGLTIDTTVTDTTKPYKVEDFAKGVGLFGTYAGEKLENIRLVDTVIQLIEACNAESVGVLAGQVDGSAMLTIENCYVYLSEKYAKELANGVTTLQNVKRVISGGTYTGGLVGSVHKRVDVKKSFAATSIDGQKTGDITAKNYKPGGYVGGLFGYLNTSETVKIEESYADNYLFGVNAAGLVGLIENTQPLEIEYCYAAGYVCGSGDTADFVLMRTKDVTNNSMTMKNSYSVVSQLTAPTGKIYYGSNGKWNTSMWSNTNKPTVFVPGAEAATQNLSYGFQFRSDMIAGKTDGKTFIQELNGGSSGKFKDVIAENAVSNPYNLMSKGLKDYPFPVLISGNDPSLRKSKGDDPAAEVYRHFGDWRVTFNSGIVYYEKYYDTETKTYSYGFTGMGGDIGLAKNDAEKDSKKQIVADGYAYALRKEDYDHAKTTVTDTAIPHLKVVFTGGTTVASGAAEEKIRFDKEYDDGLKVVEKKEGEEEKTYVLIPLDAYIESKLPENAMPAGYNGKHLYYAISINDNIYYFNPYFSQSVRTDLNSKKANDLFVFNIRTARQLNKLSENKEYWKLEQLDIKQDYDIDYRYYRGYAPNAEAGYTGVIGGANKTNTDYANFKRLINPKRFNLPAKQTAIQEPIGVYGNDFKANYDGGGHVITGVNFALEAASGQSTMIGLFGSNSGKLSNITLNGNHAQDSGEPKNAEGIYGITKSNINGSGTNVYLGALVGRNSNTGIIENCAVTGYRTASNVTESSYSKILPTYTNSFLYVGGLVGENAGNITKCSSDVPEIEVTSTSAIVYGGAFTGYNSGRITTCYAFGRLRGALDTLLNAYYGGFAGYNLGIINSAYCASSVVVGGLADRYSFTCNGGSLVDCYYVTDTDGSYYGNVYAYLNDDEHIPAGVTKIEGFKDRTDESGNEVKGLDSLTVTGFAKAEKATVTTQAAPKGASEPEFPYPAVITRGGKLVSVGNWPTDAELGKVGIIYWEHERGGNNSGYRFATLSAEGVRNSTLCAEHDDGGYVDRFGYGYYYYFPEGTQTAEMVEWEITDAAYVNLPIADRNDPGKIVNEGKAAPADIEVANALAEAMPGYQFVVYQSGEGDIDKDLQMIGMPSYENMGNNINNNFLNINGANSSQYLPNAYFVLNPKKTATQPGQSGGNDPNASNQGNTNQNDPNQNGTQDPNAPTGEFEHVFVFNPFFGNSMKVYKKEKNTAWENAQALVQAMRDLGTGKKEDNDPDTYDNQYSIRSVAQLQMINWNSYSSDTKQQVQDFNPHRATYTPYYMYETDAYGNRVKEIGSAGIEHEKLLSDWRIAQESEKIRITNENFLYLRYVYVIRNENSNTSQAAGIGGNGYGQSGYNFRWKQSHDVEGEGNGTEFIPIGSLRDIGTPGGYDFSSYPYIVYFCGVYDGSQYEIRNINITSDVTGADDGRQAIGLFGVTMGAELKNIVMYSKSGRNYVETGHYIMGWYTIGGLVGFAAKGLNDDSVISNCSIAGYEIVDQRKFPGGNGGGNVGGLIGATNMPIINCTAVTNINIDIAYADNAAWEPNPGGWNDYVHRPANLRVGGLTGCLRNTMENCYSGGKISYGNNYINVTNGNHDNLWTWIGGLNGGIYMRGARMEDLIGPTGKATGANTPDQTPTIRNCYSYMELPANDGRAKGIQSIASNGEYQRGDFPATVTVYGSSYTFTTNVRIENSFALSAGIQGATDYNTNRHKDRPSNGWYNEVNLLKDTWNQNAWRAGGSIIIKQIESHGPYLNYEEMSSKLFDYLKDAGFGRVTSEEDGVTVNGKYSFNSASSLEGKNYPFPTILHQTSNNVTYNVHYGDWPNSGIIVPVTETIDLLTDREVLDDNANPKVLGAAAKVITAEITSDVSADGNLEIAITDPNANTIASAEIISNSGRTRRIKITGHKQGIATFKLSYTANNFTYIAYVTVVVKADIKLAGIPEKITVFADTTQEVSTLVATTPPATPPEWEWRAYAGNTVPVPDDPALKLSGGTWLISANKDSGLTIHTADGKYTGGTPGAGPAGTATPAATADPAATATPEPTQTPTPAATADPAATPTPDPTTDPAAGNETVTVYKIGDDGKIKLEVDENPLSNETSVTVQYNYEYSYTSGGQLRTVTITGSQIVPVTIVPTQRVETQAPAEYNVDGYTEFDYTDIRLQIDDGNNNKEDIAIPEGTYEYWEVKYFNDDTYMTEDDTVNKAGEVIDVACTELAPSNPVVRIKLYDPNHAKYYVRIVGGTLKAETVDRTNPTEEEKQPQFAILLKLSGIKHRERIVPKMFMMPRQTATSQVFAETPNVFAVDEILSGETTLFSLSPIDDMDNDDETADTDDDGSEEENAEAGESAGENNLLDYDWMPYEILVTEEGTEAGSSENSDEKAMSIAVSQMMKKLNSDGTLEGGVSFENKADFDPASLVDAQLNPETGEIQVVTYETDIKLPQTLNLVFYGVRKDMEADTAEEESSEADAADEESEEETAEAVNVKSQEEEEEKADYMVIVQPVTIVKSIDLGEKIVTYGDDEEEPEEEFTEDATEDDEETSAKKKSKADQLLVKDGDELFDTSGYEWIPVVYEDPDYTTVAADELWTADYAEELAELLENGIEIEEEAEEPETEEEGQEKTVEINEKITLTVANLLVTVFEPKKSSMTFFVLERPEEKEESELDVIPTATPEDITDDTEDEAVSASPSATLGSVKEPGATAFHASSATATPTIKPDIDVLGSRRSKVVPGAIPDAGAGENTADDTAGNNADSMATPTAESADTEEDENDTVDSPTPSVTPKAKEDEEKDSAESAVTPKDPMVVAYLRFYGIKTGDDFPSVVISLKVITEEAKVKEPAATPRPALKLRAIPSVSPSTSPMGSPAAEVSESPSVSPSGSPVDGLSESPAPSESNTSSASPVPGAAPVPTIIPESTPSQGNEDNANTTENPVPGSKPPVSENQDPVDRQEPTAISTTAPTEKPVETEKSGD